MRWFLNRPGGIRDCLESNSNLKARDLVFCGWSLQEADCPEDLKIEVSGGRTSGLIEKVMRLPLKLLFPFGCGPPSILLLSEVLLVHVWMQS